MNFSLSSFGSLGGVLGLVFVLLTAIVHVAFAFSVWADAANLVTYQRRATFLVGGTLWALATLLGGVFAVGIYWMVHHSTLRPTTTPTERE